MSSLRFLFLALTALTLTLTNGSLAAPSLSDFHAHSTVAPSIVRPGAPNTTNDHRYPPIENGRRKAHGHSHFNLQNDTRANYRHSHVHLQNDTRPDPGHHHYPSLKNGTHRINDTNRYHHHPHHHPHNGTRNATAHAQSTTSKGFLSNAHSLSSKTTLTEITTEHPTKGQTGMWGEAAGPTIRYPPPRAQPSKPPLALAPALHFSRPKNNPQNWKPSADHTLDYAEGGMSTPDHQHHFARANYTFRDEVVGLEFSDGIQNVECKKDHWIMNIKDQHHLEVAEKWPQTVTLMMFGFCNAGNGRLFIQARSHSRTGPREITVMGERMDINTIPKKYMRTEIGLYKPPAQRKRDLGSAVPKPRDPTITPAPTIPKHNKRGLFGGFTSAIGGLTSDAGSVVSDATSGAESVVSDATSGAESMATQASSAISSVASEATSGAESVVSDVTSGAVSVASKVTSAVASVANDIRHFNKTWGTNWHVSHPTAPPTSSSPFRPAVTKLGTIHNLDIWDLGVGIVGNATLEGSLAVDFLTDPDKAVKEAKVTLDVDEFEMNLPVGIVADASDLQHSFTFDLGNIEVVPPGYVLEGFAVGNWWELDLNVTLGVKASGQFDLGTNLSISNAKAQWDMLDSNGNENFGWKPEVKNWFHSHDGQAEIKAAIGFDVKYAFGYNITALQNIPGNKLLKFSSVEASLVESIALEAKALIDIPDSKRKRDLPPESGSFTRNHPKDILRRELAKFDTCDKRGGIPFMLSLADNFFMQAGVGALIGTKVPIWTWTTPLWSTCFENAQPKGDNDTHSNRTSPNDSRARPTLVAQHDHKGNKTGHATPGDSSSGRRHPQATKVRHNSSTTKSHSTTPAPIRQAKEKAHDPEPSSNRAKGKSTKLS